jgi:drug/metabolite transporter (DMT)-like permease
MEHDPPAAQAAVDMAPQETRHGILIMLVGVMCIALIDPAAKYAARDLPVLQVVWGRYAFAALTAIVLFRPSANPANWGVVRLRLQLLRAVLLLSATVFNFLALRSLGLVENQAIVMLGPVVITAFSILVFRERTTPAIMAGLLAGLVGALVVIRPGGDVFKVGSLFALGHVLSYAFYVLLSKRLLKTDTALSLNVMAVFLPAAVLSVAVVPIWVWPQDLASWFSLASVGFVGGLGHFLLVLAHRHAPASTLAPLTYAQLCWALAAGFLIFQEIPALLTAIGALMIVASGALILYCNRR